MKLWKRHPLALISTVVALLVWLVATYEGMKSGQAFTMALGSGTIVGAIGLVGLIVWYSRFRQ